MANSEKLNPVKNLEDNEKPAVVICIIQFISSVDFNPQNVCNDLKILLTSCKKVMYVLL